jgi:CRP/FNR family transcriptional regulator, cyclic AMP receptor protein
MGNYLAHSFLASLPPFERDELLALGREARFPRGRPLARIGARGDDAFLITSGFVKVLADSAEGRTILLAVRMPGDLVGELAVLDGGSRTASVQAASLVTATVISAAALAGHMAARPAVATAVRDTISARLREAIDYRIEMDNAAPVRRRLARGLCLLAERCGTPAPDGTVIAAPLSQADLSCLISTTEQSLRRSLAALREEKLLRWEYRKAIITDLERLREVAGIRPALLGARSAA